MYEYARTTTSSVFPSSSDIPLKPNESYVTNITTKANECYDTTATTEGNVCYNTRDNYAATPAGPRESYDDDLKTSDGTVYTYIDY